MAASSSSSSSSRAYEVFLSFRGADTRLTFTDCLYEALVDDGVDVFIDSEGLHLGDKIEELLQVVSSSKIFLVVFSKGYASSAWCLREIERAVDLHESTGTPKILPIFLDVTPADVKAKTALYADALNKHREKHGDDQVGRWKAALEMVAELSGLEGQGKGYSKLIKSVVGEILTMVKNKERFVTDLVGIDKRINDVMELLCIGSQEVRFIGFHGMGGIGKTTLAKFIFNRLHTSFEKCSFLSDVRESVKKNGLIDLQKKLLCDLHNSSNVDSNVTDVDEGRRFIEKRANSKKVLIVLDDIDENEQLENLVGVPSSLGLGSRVLITTRDKGILDAVDGIIAYELGHLDSNQALKLFSMHAFKCDFPPHNYQRLSEEVVSKTGGLPLTLSVIGSDLYKRKEEIWRETLDRLSRTPPEKVQDKLMISYNKLSEDEKCIFLDIACFLIHEEKGRAMDVWKACGFQAETAIEVLANKSLIKIEDWGCIWMHDQLRDLGREIVFQENPKDKAGRSRLWNHEEALAVVSSKKVIEGVNTLEALDELRVWDCTSLEAVINVQSTNIKDDCRIFVRRCGKMASTDEFIPLTVYRESVISYEKEKVGADIYMVDLLSIMESQEPHIELHQRPSQSSSSSHQVEMATRLHLGPPQCSCSSVKEIEEGPLIPKNHIMMEDKDLKSSVRENDIELQLRLPQPLCLSLEETEGKSLVLQNQSKEEIPNDGERFEIFEYQMRPSYFIDFLQQAPRCHHGEVANVRETTPTVATPISQDHDTQLFFAPSSSGTKELFSRKRKNPFI